MKDDDAGERPALDELFSEAVEEDGLLADVLLPRPEEGASGPEKAPR